MPIHFPIGPIPCLSQKGGGMCLKCPPPLDPPMSIVCPSDESCISSPTISMHIIVYKKGKIIHTEGNIKQNGLLHMVEYMLLFFYNKGNHSRLSWMENNYHIKMSTNSQL